MAKCRGTEPAAKINKRSRKKSSGPGPAARTAAESGGELVDVAPMSQAGKFHLSLRKFLVPRSRQLEKRSKRPWQNRDCKRKMLWPISAARNSMPGPWSAAFPGRKPRWQISSWKLATTAIACLPRGNFTVAELDELCPFSIVDVRQCCGKLRRKCLGA